MERDEGAPLSQSAEAVLAAVQRSTEALRAEMDALIEEQNVLAHMFVAADRLSRARSPREGIDVAVEVLHNLVGVHRYAIWLRASSESAPRVVAPADPRWRATESPDDLVTRGFASVSPVRGKGSIPVAFPLVLDGTPVGVIEIREMVPQVDNLGRLQEDLLVFLSERLASAMVQAGLAAKHGLNSAWAQVADSIDPVEKGHIR
ncbi:MAG TPA: hypothetical protein VL463_22245 [Kofleriaceae bacterium]|nr:hypothetical protein [Kofleriaceae bacterium]